MRRSHSLFDRSERSVLAECLRYLERAGRGFFWRNNTGAMAMFDRKGKKRVVRFGIPGASDILGILKGGRFCAIECKSSKGRLTAVQLAFLQEVRELGGVGLCVRSANELHEKLEACLFIRTPTSQKGETHEEVARVADVHRAPVGHVARQPEDHGRPRREG